MKAIVRDAPMVAPPADDAGGVAKSGLREYARVLRQGCRQVFGVPDYERYLTHMAAHHPGEPLLSRRDFFVQAIDRKYGKSGPRCC